MPIRKKVDLTKVMKSLSGITLIFPLYLLLLGACHEDVFLEPDQVVINEQEQKAPQLTPEWVFSKLRGRFLNPILSGDLKKLREITKDRNYLDYLFQEYPEQPFTTFEEFLEKAQPAPERYLPFLEKTINNPTVEDIAILHKITRHYRNARALEYHILSNPDPNVVARLNEVFEKKASAIEDKTVQEWLVLHFDAEKIPPLEFVKIFTIPFENFVIETEKADVLRIEALFEEHGRNDGTIWLAILEPILIGQIVNGFTDVEVFLNWVKGDFFPDQPLELPQQAIDLLQ